MVAADTFRFLNAERRCVLPRDWDPPDAARLWTYNLHYFDDLNSTAADRRRQWHYRILDRWVAENAPGQGPGWEPYTVSRRIVNWVKWAIRGGTLSAELRTSLAVQTRWLCRRLEYHILGNHLFANAKALIHAGLYFEGDEAREWYARGLNIVTSELREQILADGGHFELSTLYHAAALEDLLDLLNLVQAHAIEPPQSWYEIVAGMTRWLSVMSHPDGNIAFFNDAAFGVAPKLAELEAYALRLSIPPAVSAATALTVLDASGYVRATSPHAYLVCDCAAIGADYLPAHGHADTLSFELSLFGQRVLVNSGTSEYGTGEERHRQRSTAAHNTVVIDGENSSEVWGGFRVGRRASVCLERASAAQDVVVDASHDGYRRLPGRNVHRRRWSLQSGSLTIEDRIAGAYRSAEAFFHLHPEIAVQRDEDKLLLWGRGFSVTMTFEGAARVTLQAGTWHPEFGRSQPNKVVVMRFGSGQLRTRLIWG